MDIQAYLDEVRALYASGQTTEHSFRPALARLFESIDPALTVINEPKHITDVGAPDFVFNRGDVAIGWCEAKDIGKDIHTFTSNDYSKEQKERYRKGLSNLIYTNGLDFEFIRDGEMTDFITIADIFPALPARAKNFPLLENRLRDFAHVTPLSITSSRRLAEMMAGKAVLIKDIMGRALAADFRAQERGARPTDLIGQYEAFRTSLIHDITVTDFADIYAETIAYGLFAARLHDATPDTFTRQEALELLPKSNPFLRELFIYIAGPNLDERLRRVIDELCNVFRATNVSKVLANFGKITVRSDPFLHFYEVFLAEYNPTKRKARGVWYTPEPEVNFIVRVVDDVLKTEFALADGLADTSRIIIDWDTGQNDPKTGKPVLIKKQVHRVQILDPATGTGSFLAEVVKLIAGRIKGIAPGQWSNYVEQDLLPRIHGFELLMASYAMCHMKLDMTLTALGYQPSAQPPRLGVYLTNSLEEGERAEHNLFGLSRAIAEEAEAASDIKRQTPIMCVIGNPPYSGESANKGSWIMELLETYKKEPGSKQKLQERNPKWINDDYVKFIRFAEHMIDKNGEGVLGFITNHGYLDNPTFRGMRWQLMHSFDRIHVLDLHGNARKKEVSPDGSPDKNVFDIMQGVAIIVAVKHHHDGKKKPLAEVRHGDLWGSREAKNEALWRESLPELTPNLLLHKAPQYPFVARDHDLETEYAKGFSVAELMPVNSVGIVTSRDELTIDMDRDALWQRVRDFVDTDAETLRLRYGLGKDVLDWSVAGAKADVAANLSPIRLMPIAYRPFDTRWTYYTGNSRGFQCRPRNEVMRHFVGHKNIAIMVPRQAVQGGGKYSHIVAISEIVDNRYVFSNKGIAQQFPLYLYPDEGALDKSIRINFDPRLYAEIRKAAGLTNVPTEPDGTDIFRRVTGDACPDEVKVFDYIYGVLHCPAYRETYAVFLKTDFPRIPFPPSPEVFAAVSAQGETLRRLHLMEPVAIGETPYPFCGEECGSVVNKPRFEAGPEDGKVWINASQYFDHVPAVAWDFPIGGYQPAQKWLKDRKGRALSFDDIRHYQRIIKILAETEHVMREIKFPIQC